VRLVFKSCSRLRASSDIDEPNRHRTMVTFQRPRDLNDVVVVCFDQALRGVGFNPRGVRTDGSGIPAATAETN
jgi:hypothetical protein